MKKLLAIVLSTWMLLVSSLPIDASRGQILGVHILNLYELDAVTQLLKTDQTRDSWQFITIPLTFSDLEKKSEWQVFLDQAGKSKLIPIIRLATEVENGSWKIPTRKDITREIDFLSDLNWPTQNRYIIVLNEPNHAKEFGSTLNPQKYAEILTFTSFWARSEDKNYVILPAGMDLAANNSALTMESFAFLEKMYQADPDIFSYIDIWNSHSYPNPGFSSSPVRTDKKSLRGFKHELDYLKKKTGRDFSVIITETGWVENGSTRPWLDSYYEYAFQNVWNDPRVIGVTPFVFQGAPGPFAGFSFLDGNGQPTIQYLAYQKLLNTQ